MKRHKEYRRTFARMKTLVNDLQHSIREFEKIDLQIEFEWSLKSDAQHKIEMQNFLDLMLRLPGAYRDFCVAPHEPIKQNGGEQCLTLDNTSI